MFRNVCSIGNRLFSTSVANKLSRSIFQKYQLLDELDIKDAICTTLGVEDKTCQLTFGSSGLTFSILPSYELTLHIPRDPFDKYVRDCLDNNESTPLKYGVLEEVIGLSDAFISKKNITAGSYVIQMRPGSPLHIEQKHLNHFACFISSCSSLEHDSAKTCSR